MEKIKLKNIKLQIVVILLLKTLKTIAVYYKKVDLS